MFIFMIGLLHAICEVIIILPLYFSHALPEANYAQGFLYSIFTLVGIGTLIHSTVDFVISLGVWKVLVKANSVSSISTVKTMELRS